MPNCWSTIEYQWMIGSFYGENGENKKKFKTMKKIKEFFFNKDDFYLKMATG